MATVTSSTSTPRFIDAAPPSGGNAEQPNKPAAAATAAAKPAAADVAISTLASRLSRASIGFEQAAMPTDRKAYADKLQGNIDKILYPLDDAHKGAAALQLPQPNDAAAAQSAKAATAFVNDSAQGNPFAGLSREQLATITHDDSGTFTLNERRAAFMQAYNEEQAWRTQAVEKAQREYSDTGKLTEFFKDTLAHFIDLPKTEQALYPANYAADLGDKIKLDFNYRSGLPGNASGAAAIPENTAKRNMMADVRSQLQIPDAVRTPSVT